jgi:hypothetical protein
MASNALRIDTNSLGDRGESILAVALLTLHGKKPLFRPAHLGAKWPTADYVVELMGKPGRFFLVQVKATRRGFLKNGRLGIQVRKDKFNLLASTLVPRYVVGVDDVKEDVFICAAATRRKKHLSSLTTSHSLKSKSIRRLLFNEVDAFWKSIDRKRFVGGAFADT